MLAADNQWLKLVDDCIADVERMSRPSNGAIGASTAGQPPHGELIDATLQAAAVKSRHGSDKGACQILTGGPPVPPGPETDAKLMPKRVASLGLNP